MFITLKSSRLIILRKSFLFGFIFESAKVLQFQIRSSMASSEVNGAAGEVKIPRMSAKIGTHNGKFHCDEILACHMLKLLPEYKDAEIIRTRDPLQLEKCDIVVDVGGVYDPKLHRYDHHQSTFSETGGSFVKDKSWKIKLSSAGLIYMHFGQRIIAKLLNIEESSKITQIIFTKLYENFIQEIDAIDNGVQISSGEVNYLINTNLSSRVANLNPTWNDKNQDEWVAFSRALTLVGEEFNERVNYYNSVWWPAREIVEAAVTDRFKVDESGEIISFPNQFVPWLQHLADIEEETNLEPNIKFALFADKNGMWRVQTVPVSRGSFISRIPLKEEWRGMRDEELSKISNIPNCIFVHNNGFIGGNKDYEGVLEMARKTMKAT